MVLLDFVMLGEKYAARDPLVDQYFTSMSRWLHDSSFQRRVPATFNLIILMCYILRELEKTENLFELFRWFKIFNL